MRRRINRTRRQRGGAIRSRARRQRGGRGRRRFQAGGHGHEIGHGHDIGYHTHGGVGPDFQGDWNSGPWGTTAGMYLSGSFSAGQAGRHYHNTGISPAGRMRRGGRVRRQGGGGMDITLTLPKPWNGR